MSACRTDENDVHELDALNAWCSEPSHLAARSSAKRSGEQAVKAQPSARWHPAISHSREDKSVQQQQPKSPAKPEGGMLLNLCLALCTCSRSRVCKVSGAPACSSGAPHTGLARASRRHARARDASTDYASVCAALAAPRKTDIMGVRSSHLRFELARAAAPCNMNAMQCAQRHTA